MWSDEDDPRGPRRPADPQAGASTSTRRAPGVAVRMPTGRSVAVEFPGTSNAAPVYGSPHAPTVAPLGVATPPPGPVPIAASLHGSPSRILITFDRTMQATPYPDDLAPQFTVRHSGGSLGPYTGVSVTSISGAVVTVTLTPSLPGSIPVGGWTVDFEAGPVALLGPAGYPAPPFTGFVSDPTA